MIISVGLLPDGTIPNGNPFQNVPVETLVSLCLVLRLNEDEAVDYLARCERAFSPAKPVTTSESEMTTVKLLCFP